MFTPWCRVLLEKLTGLQLVKKFLAFHETRRFITALTSVHHLSLSWASPIQSIYTHPTSWRSFLILSTHLRLGLPSGLLPSGFPSKTLYTPSPHPYAPHAQPISFFSILSSAQYRVRSTSQRKYCFGRNSLCLSCQNFVLKQTGYDFLHFRFIFRFIFFILPSSRSYSEQCLAVPDTCINHEALLTLWLKKPFNKDWSVFYMVRTNTANLVCTRETFSSVIGVKPE